MSDAITVHNSNAWLGVDAGLLSVGSHGVQADEGAQETEESYRSRLIKARDA
jgi:hypothetical protein